MRGYRHKIPRDSILVVKERLIAYESPLKNGIKYCVFGKFGADLYAIIIRRTDGFVNPNFENEGDFRNMSWFKKEELLDRSTLLFSNKALISVIVPLVLQQVFAVLVGTIDTMMVAYTGEAAVSGVSLVNTLDTLLVIFFTAMVTGGSVVISQALGKKESQETHESAKQLLYISTAIAIVLAAVVVLLRRPLLYLLFGSVEVDVMHHAMGYFFFVALSFPALAIIESAGACFRSAGNTVISLAVSLVANLLNVCGNAIFIMVFDMGGAGAGLSTLIARVVAAIISLVLVHQKKRVVHVEQLLRYKPNPNVIRRILHIGVPNGLVSNLF